MAADTTILQGEVMENPGERKLDVEALLAGLMRSLLAEQEQQQQQQNPQHAHPRAQPASPLAAKVQP